MQDKLRTNWHTSILNTSVKKLKAIAREMKGMKIGQVIEMISTSNKRIAIPLNKSIKCIANNIGNFHKEEISNVYNNYNIQFVVIERKKRFRSGLRYRARGSAASSYKNYSCLNIQVKCMIDNNKKVK